MTAEAQASLPSRSPSGERGAEADEQAHFLVFDSVRPTLRMASPSLLAELGYAGDELGRIAPQRLLPDVSDHAWSRLVHRAAEGRTPRFEGRLQRKDGT